MKLFVDSVLRPIETIRGHAHFASLLKKDGKFYLQLLTHQNIIVIVLEKYCAIFNYVVVNF